LSDEKENLSSPLSNCFFLRSAERSESLPRHQLSNLCANSYRLAKWKAVGKTPSNVAERIYETVSNDLTLSGFFKVITYPTLPPSLQRKEGIPSTVVLQEWTPVGSEILLAAEVSALSDPLDIAVTFHLFDLVEEKHLVGKQYEGSVQLIRHMAHRIADEVVLQLTGERGVHTTKVAYVVAQGITCRQRS
jgi:Tol biopolymer transport system component